MAQKVSRRAFLRMTGLVAGASVLAACAPATAPSQPAQPAAAQPTAAAAAAQPTAAAAAPAAGQTVVEWWDIQTGVGADVQQKMRDQFEKENPDIKINYTYVAQSQTSQANEKLLTAVAAGTPPGVFYFDRFIVAQFAAQGFLTDLTDMATKTGIKQDDYWPFAWEEANYKGKLYALPYDTDTRALWYNKDAFTAAGLDPEKPPTTWQELQDTADKLTKTGAGKRITQWGYLPTADQAWIYTYGFSNKGVFQDPQTKKITSADPKIVESMTWLKSYVDHVGVDNVDAFVAACQGTQCNDQNDYFWTGQAAMVCSGDWKVAQAKQYKPNVHYGVAPFPGKSAPAPDASWAGGWSWVVPKGAKNLDADWKVISWVCGPEGQDMYNKGTYHIPTNKKAAADPFYTADPLHKVFMDLLPVSHTRPPIPAGSLLWDSLVQARTDIIHGVAAPDAALKSVDDKVNAELEKLGYFTS